MGMAGMAGMGGLPMVNPAMMGALLNPAMLAAMMQGGAMQGERAVARVEACFDDDASVLPHTHMNQSRTWREAAVCQHAGAAR